MKAREHYNDKLSPDYRIYSTVLGISQEDVDAGRSFRPLFAEFMAWLADINIVGKRVIPVVLDHELRAVLKEQCSLSSCVYPEFAKTWVSLKVRLRYSPLAEFGFICQVFLCAV